MFCPSVPLVFYPHSSEEVDESVGDSKWFRTLFHGTFDGQMLSITYRLGQTQRKRKVVINPMFSAQITGGNEGLDTSTLDLNILRHRPLSALGEEQASRDTKSTSDPQGRSRGVWRPDVLLTRDDPSSMRGTQKDSRRSSFTRRET